LAELLTAEKLDSSNPVIQNNLALAYLVRGRLKEAETHVRQALDLNPKYTDARNNLGRILIEKKDYAGAIKELKVAIQDLTYPEPQRPLANLGEAYFLSGRYEDARKVLLEALQNQRTDCFSMALYGRSLYQLKQYSQAADSLDEATRTCESNNREEPFYYSALSYVKLGKSDQAYARLKECVETFPRGHYTARAKNLMREIQ
jgi:Tfp pilus assembly protein PilF